MTDLDVFGTDVLVKSLADKQRLIKELTEEADAIKAVLREREPVGTEEEYGDYQLIIAPNRRFNAKKVKALLTEEEFAQVAVLTADSKKVKALFEDRYAEFQDEGDPKVIIKERED